MHSFVTNNISLKIIYCDTYCTKNTKQIESIQKHMPQKPFGGKNQCHSLMGTHAQT